tara:strand:- start:46 stop:531 length:486 start_codon:yes stop_codon:yes gene_type:complete
MYIKYLKYAVIQPLVELGLSPSQLLLANIIISFSKEDKPLIGGYTTIGKLINVSGKTVQRDIIKLQEHKLVGVKSGRFKRNANQYFPTKKLKRYMTHSPQSYRQNVRIDIDKKSANTPKGYYSKEDYLKSLPHKEKTMAEFQLSVGRTLDEVKEMLNKIRR